MPKLRVTSKERGDDTKMSRFVKDLPTDHGSQSATSAAPKNKTRQPRDFTSPTTASHEGRTMHPQWIKSPDDGEPLRSGHNNYKLGAYVKKGIFKDYSIFQLSLEERKTCPSSCQHWNDCYGNTMHRAVRVDHSDFDLLKRRIREQVASLLRPSKRHAGLLIRLHTLGDFFSLEYVDFWAQMLHENPRLAIWGYTARPPASKIGTAIALLHAAHGPRFAVRFSDAPLPLNATRSLASEDAPRGEAIICPEQLGKTQCCGTCALCWNTRRNIAFIDHIALEEKIE